MGLKHKRKIIFYYALVILLIPVIAYVASVAINDQTKSTDVATDDVFPFYDTSNTAGRGITGQNLSSGLAAIITEGDLTDSSVVSADIKNGEIAQDDVNQTWTYGSGESQTFTSAQDQSAGITISNSQATVSGETKLLTLDFSAETNDTNLTYFDVQDSGGAIWQFKGGATRAQMTGDFDLVVSALDLGSAVLEVPNSTGPTVDAAGELAVDTTDDQLVFYGGAKRVVTYKHRECFTLESPAAADDNVPIFSHDDAITITDMRCWTEGGTSAEITLSDGTNDLDTMTCDADGADDDGTIANSTFTALEQMEFDTGTVTGTVDWVNFCFTYTVTAE